MDIFYLLIFIFPWISSVSFSDYNFVIYQSISDESVILGEIITNYLVKYFSDDRVFVSIIFAPLKKQRNHFKEDFLLNLFDDPALTKFDHNILDRLDTSTHYRHSFNIILIDDSKSLLYVGFYS